MTVPASHPRGGSTGGSVPNYGALLQVVLGHLELEALRREQLKMAEALNEYASRIPKGEKVIVDAWFKNKEFVGIRPANEPQLLDGIR